MQVLVAVVVGQQEIWVQVVVRVLPLRCLIPLLELLVWVLLVVGTLAKVVILQQMLTMG
jgi:hypothetical protein